MRERHWVPDTSVVVGYLRFGRNRELLLGGIERGLVLLPGVVLCELYAGATSGEDRADLERLRRALGASVLGTEVGDWVLAGRCLARYAARFGRIKPRDHMADVLVAVVAERVRAALVSEDSSQMTRWRWVLRKLGRSLDVRAPSSRHVLER